MPAKGLCFIESAEVEYSQVFHVHREDCDHKFSATIPSAKREDLDLNLARLLLNASMISITDEKKQLRNHYV
jgi:hypothetical protein